MDYSRRRKTLSLALSKKKLGGFLATSPESRRYLSGFTAEDLGCKESSGILLVLRDEAYLFTDGRYDLQAKEETSGINIVVCKNGLHKAIAKILKHVNVKRIGFEASSINVRLFTKIKVTCKNIEFIEYDDLILTYRLQKEPEEIELIRRSVEVGELCFKKALSRLGPGMTEREASVIILENIYKYSEGPSFPPIVASGPNAALPHAIPQDRIIKENEPVIIDMGVKIEGYASDMTRTIFFGEPTDKFKEIYACVKEAKETAQKAIRAGMTGRDADHIARAKIKEHGFGNYFVHGLGHGVGLSVHEPPNLSPRYRRRLHTNSVVTVEPGIYIPGEGGVRLEDMVVIKEDGVELLGSGRWIYDF
ncbi:Aminopeptidase [Dissulfuribacter thermophilus]|uniref:Aminopeptidase n=1 Tax=Dissulfuribacter thermophilus TaxID=1156395 RepID=A0A1B9F992_9BACT|nr:Xaa-Pro peptidase family protein [Dissulfuribacter thermophilus]OCC16480.1 Aminopeptidase [Dissulfuribacter thermophilus]